MTCVLSVYIPVIDVTDGWGNRIPPSEQQSLLRFKLSIISSVLSQDGSLMPSSYLNRLSIWLETRKPAVNVHISEHNVSDMYRQTSGAYR